MSNPSLAGKYELKRQIGRGGMGQIWEAEDQQLRRRVALKLLTPDHMESPTSRGRFEREARAIAQLKNQHVVHIYDYGVDEGRPYIVMELLEGEDLASRLDRIGQLPLPAVVPIITQTARGLAAAHAAGIVHRDLKPANVFLARSEAEELVKILDFGVVTLVSKPDDLHLTSAGGLVGTPVYMSPEQIRGAAVDHRSDLWSLGVLAYRAITGQHPFSGQWLGTLVVKICTDSFPAPSTLVEGLKPEVDRFFERALAKDPAQRFQSAREMATAFAALVEANARGPAKILVVDDEPDVPLLVKQRFRHQIRKGIYDFAFAADGEAALAALRKQPDIDIVLTDINMPGMDGLTLLSRVSEVNPLVRTVIVSAYGDMSNIRTAMNRGAFDFLVKPIDFNDLELTIEKTFKQVSELRSNARSSHENNVLRMFVSPSLIEQLRGTGGLSSCEVWEGTVVFIDVAGFNDATSNKPLDEAVHILNANFEVIVPEITRRGGVVDKFLGDAVMAVFRGDDHVARAIDACLTLRAQIQPLAHRAGDGSPFSYGISIGMATGEMISGAIGSKSFNRLDYTVLGEVVSTAAQLEKRAAPNQILMSDVSHTSASASFKCAPRGVQVIVGRSEPMRVFEVLRRLVPGEPGVADLSPEAAVETIEIEHDQETVAKGIVPPPTA